MGCVGVIGEIDDDEFLLVLVFEFELGVVVLGDVG